MAFSLKEQIAIICQGKELEQVETFKYLGAISTENDDCSKEIQARLGAAKGAVRSLDFVERQVFTCQG